MIFGIDFLIFYRHLVNTQVLQQTVGNTQDYASWLRLCASWLNS